MGRYKENVGGRKGSDALENTVAQRPCLRSLLDRMCDVKPGFAIRLMVAMILTLVNHGRIGEQDEKKTKIPKAIGVLIRSDITFWRMGHIFTTDELLSEVKRGSNKRVTEMLPSPKADDGAEVLKHHNRVPSPKVFVSDLVGKRKEEVVLLVGYPIRRKSDAERRWWA
ncbi:hypothetical protein NLI96_g9506 [Meripilus lineatus]|uniref:Uncharacterized protein n=1 Tax=Meripilus lineatus TaxID=2056292 RepID=A0AAD5UVA7_9APHY|nr:hypothetical protein NLI96_g9506 [Physisporinus lineatus]